MTNASVRSCDAELEALAVILARKVRCSFHAEEPHRGLLGIVRYRRRPIDEVIDEAVLQVVIDTAHHLEGTVDFLFRPDRGRTGGPA